MRKAAIILTILTLALCIAIVATGCKTRVITNHTSETKTITIKQKDTTFIYQGGSIQNGNDIDSIKAQLEMLFKQGLNGVENKVVYKSADNKVALTFWLDKMGKLQADCSSKDSSYQATIKNITERFEKEKSTHTVEPVKYIPNFWKYIFFGLVGAVIILLLVLWYILKNIDIKF